MEKVYRVLGKRGRVTIPWEIRQRVGFGHNDIVSFAEAPDGQSVIVKKEWICDDCECQGEGIVEEEGAVTLLEFLSELSPEQQRAAFVHLLAMLT